MPFAQGTRSGLSIQAETTFGVAPAVPALVSLPYNTHNLDLNKERVQGGAIQPDRMTRTDRHGNRTASGDIVVDLQKADFDPLFESVFMNTFSTNVLKVGTTVKSFHIEDTVSDITQHRLFSGMSVSKLAVSIKPNQMVTGVFSLVGKNMAVSATSFDAVKTAASTNQPFDSYSGLIRIADAGGILASIATVTGVDFTIDNGFSPTFVVGASTTPQLEYGMATVEGTITAYFEDNSLINRFINETQTAFEVAVDDPTGVSDYTWLFPRIKINAANTPVDNPQSRIITLPFVALYDTAENTNIKLTRSV